jgi:hypothetical protein
MQWHLCPLRCIGLACCVIATHADGQAKRNALQPETWTNPVGARIELTAPQTFSFPIINRGTIKVSDTTVRYLAPYTEYGAYLSDPSTNYFTDLTVSPSGYLTGGAGDNFFVSGNFTNNSTQNTLWNTAAAELDFTAGTGPHTFALAGADQGASYFGYINNFAWGIFRLRSGQSLVLADGNNTPGAALYASRVTLDGGTGQVSSITGNNFSIYYDPTDSGNNYLLNGAPNGVYSLSGGGVLAPVQAILKINSITHLANGHIVLQCLGVPNRVNNVQASPDLSSGSFVTLLPPPVAADASGAFQYEDTNAGSFTKRFYRLSFP